MKMRMKMKNINPISFIILTILLSLASVSTMADCHFIRLNGFEISQNPDVFFWSDLSPLIAIEAGHFYSLSPKGLESTDTNSGKVKGLQGQLYYIPQHLIDDDNNFSLRMMVIDRDKDTPDDIILPLSKRKISLASETFTINSRRLTVYFRPFGDTSPPSGNEMTYQFEILKNSEVCNNNTATGRENDWRYRMENEFKRLQVLINNYEKDPLIGGHEFHFYRFSEIKKSKYSKALAAAMETAAINSSELISLGLEIKKLNEVKNFNKLWEEYTQLIQRLIGQNMTLKYKKDAIWQKLQVPTLSFHPQWKQISSNASGLNPPKEWKINLPEEE